ncbi:tautomerase family protein [Herbaspirillum sp. ST 5-3]|uniref:tautomerase family protein n=1 Tax=Oxalobacteraceae TaxID=75682 RepID=UPI001455E994|nr:tautomerase family protein [Herbaspirillum sp. ST 5-3]
MAIVRIDFSTTRSSAFGKTVAGVVDRVMSEILSVPARENFIVCQAHEEGMLLHDPENVSLDRLGKIVFIQITLNQGRTDELKEKFFAELTSRISAETGELPQNVFINLVEVTKTNWSFGKPYV